MKKTFYLSQTDKKLAGVCGGIAAYLDVDSTVIRIILIFMIIFYGTGILPYLVIWAVAPKGPTSIEVEDDKSQDSAHYDKG